MNDDRLDAMALLLRGIIATIDFVVVPEGCTVFLVGFLSARSEAKPTLSIGEWELVHTNDIYRYRRRLFFSPRSQYGRRVVRYVIVAFDVGVQARWLQSNSKSCRGGPQPNQRHTPHVATQQVCMYFT